MVPLIFNQKHLERLSGYLSKAVFTMHIIMQS